MEKRNACLHFAEWLRVPTRSTDKDVQNYISLRPNKVMDWEEKDKDIQNRIDWISATIRDTKFQLHQEHKELEKLLKEQEEHRAKKN